MKKQLVWLLSFVSLFLIGSAVSVRAVFADEKLNLVTTFYPVHEFTKAVVGDEGKVTMLIKAGTEPHDFEPTTKNVTTISDADVFVYLDENMETWVPDVKKSLDLDKQTVIKATGDMLLMAGSEEGEEEGHEGHSHAYDPHVWLSPKRAVTLVENIRDSLIKKYPDKSAVFTDNAAAYIEKLKSLDQDYTEALSQAKQTSFVTQHAAFGYLALDYGLEQIPITGVSAETEPSAKRLASLTKYVKKYDIKYIYFEENASSKVAKTLADEVGVKTQVLNPLESLSKKQIEAGEDYFSIMQANLKALRLTTDVSGKTIKAEKDTEKTVANGYFDDDDVTNRSLKNWQGEWQSVYPYLTDGTLDEVWDYKAKANKDMSAQEYKAYYTTGYQTDVEKITIDGKKKTITFQQNGQEHTYTYKYKGYEILTYKKGNRGVRYLFEATDDNAGEFKYVQFSDHGITSQKAEHFHLYWGGESQEKLLEELENWPTYYPADLSGREIAQEIIAH
ncbi:zinc ABC transporter substrate-binding protein AdcA [Streptococcus pantholopis]|uniref:Zinc-binding protein AdcA n=1 Tax=Streptococcus pantholopis TaxID=1811193 RepID=A0A172Q6M9_9STRE|nr:zinc ABC transporter substrate-binding protein AdcA [Streptococcus pantholopis]AND79055.1 zinc-binding protein AdcA [Streptococcus pantholopis]